MKSFNCGPSAACLLPVLLFGSLDSARAADYIWFPQGDGVSFSDPGNWYDLNPAADPHNPSGPPGANDIASLSSGATVNASGGSVSQLNGLGTATLTLSGNFAAQNVAGGGMTLAGTGELTAQTVTSFLTIVGGHLVANNYQAGSLSVDGGSLRITGGVQSPGLPSSFLFNVTGGAILEIQGAANDVDGSIYGGATATLNSLANLNASQSTFSVSGGETALTVSFGAEIRNNSLDITTGAALTVNGSLSLQGANSSGSSQTASSSWHGAGTEIVIGNGLTIGRGTGTYTLNLGSGGSIASGAGIVLGSDAGGGGVFNLTLGASVELGSASMIVGQQGRGVVTLDSDSELFARKLFIGRSVLDNQFTAGDDTILGIQDECIVGDGGLGTMRLMAGAQAVVERLVVGRSSQANNRVTLEGAGTALTGSGSIDVGESQGRGTVEIKASAHATLDSGLTVGFYNGSVGVLDVHDSAEITANGGTAIIGGGSPSQASVFVRNGGHFAAPNVLICATMSGTSSVHVAAGPADITPTLFQAVNNIQVGFAEGASGPALLRVTNGAYASAGTSLLVGTNGVFDTLGGRTKIGLADFPSNGTVRVGMDGALSGIGTVVGKVEVENGGKIAPGSSPGILSVQGNCQIGNGGILEIEINGTVAGDDFDKLNVSGSAVVSNGTLFVRFIDGYSPKSGQVFAFLQAGGGINGSITNVLLTGVAPGFAYHLSNDGALMSLHADNNGVATSAPRLVVSREGSSVTISWPSPGTWVLESTTNLLSGWTTVSGIPSVENDRFKMTLPMNQPRALFRLRP